MRKVLRYYRKFRDLFRVSLVIFVSNFTLFGIFVSEDGNTSEKFVVSNTRSIGNPDESALAFDGTNYLLVYSDRSQNLLGIRISPDGTILDANGGFPISSDDAINPSIVFDGTNYFVAFIATPFNQARSIAGVFVSTAGSVGNEISIASRENTVSRRPEAPDIVYDGNDFLVAWPEGVNPGTSHIYVSRVSAQGLVLDPGGVLLTATETSKFDVRVNFDGTNYRVSWADNDSNRAVEPIKFFRKLVSQNLGFFGVPITDNGSLLNTTNISGAETILISDFDIVGDVWGFSLASNDSVVNTENKAFAVWDIRFPQNNIMGAFIYPVQ